MEHFLKVQWEELAPVGSLSTDQLSETTQYCLKIKTGILITVYRSWFLRRLMAIVRTNDKFRRIPFSWLSPAHTKTVYPLIEDVIPPDVISEGDPADDTFEDLGKEA